MPNPFLTTTLTRFDNEKTNYKSWNENIEWESLEKFLCKSCNITFWGFRWLESVEPSFEMLTLIVGIKSKNNKNDEYSKFENIAPITFLITKWVSFDNEKTNFKSWNENIQWESLIKLI